MLPYGHPSIQHRPMAVRFLKADITQIDAAAVVTGEGPDLAMESGVTKSLLHHLPQFREERSRHKRQLGKEDLPFGAVLISDLTKSRVRGPRTFRYVLHAVLSQVETSEGQWLKDMGVLYNEIFKTAHDLCIPSLAVPLLGSGVADADKLLAIQALASAVVSYRSDYPTQLFIVCNDRRLLDAVHRNFDSSQSQTGGIMSFFYSVAKNGKDILKYLLGLGGDVGNRHGHNGMDKTASSGHREQEEKRQLKEAMKNSMMDVQRRPPDYSYNKQGGQRPMQTKKSHSPRPVDGRNPMRHREGHNTEYVSTESDEAIARSLQHDENTRVRKRSPPRDLRFSRRVDADGSDDDDDHHHHHDHGRDDDHDGVAHRDGINDETDSEADKASQDNNNEEQETCSICLNTISDPKILDKCGHVFCRDCIDRSFQEYKPVCPSCNMVYGEIRGNQPDGQMDVAFSGDHLPGYEGYETITITYYFPSGTQDASHPNPTRPYKGTTRLAYLPGNREGREVLKLLRKAFDRKLTFTIGRSTTTGREDVVTWNDIHHKTNKHGGPTRFGYPDATYMSRVKDELASKGVTDEPTN